MLEKEIRETENKTPSRTVFHPRRRLNVWCAVDCAGGGLGAMPTLVPSVLLLRGRSMPYWGRGVKRVGGIVRWRIRPLLTRSFTVPEPALLSNTPQPAMPELA